MYPNVDSPLVTYLTLKANQLAVFIKDVRVDVFGADEVRLRKETYNPIKPATAQGCQRQIIDMGRRGISTLVCFSDKVFKMSRKGNYKLYVYRPDVIKKNGAVVYYHGGGFTVLNVG